MDTSGATMVFSDDASLDVGDSPSAVPWVGNSTFTAVSTEALGPESKSLQTYPERAAVAVLWLLVAVVDIIGNTMVILAVVFSKKLRTSTNVFVVSLSVADLLTGLALPMSAVALLSPGHTWPWSTEAPCYLAGLLLYISSCASVFNLASIALNRLILIKRPITLYRRLYTRRNLAVNVAVLWLVAIATMVVPPLCGVGGFGYDGKHHTCSDLDTHPKAKIFERIQTFMSYPIPLFIIVSAYIFIFLHVQRHFRAQRSARGGVSSSNITGLASSSSMLPDNAAVLKTSQQDRADRQQLQITKNLFLTVCAFVVCGTPYGVALFFPNTDRYLLFLGAFFTCNGCVNPIIYAAKHPQFKKVLRRMLQCRYSQIEQPSDTLKSLMTCFQVCTAKFKSESYNVANQSTLNATTPF